MVIVLITGGLLNSPFLMTHSTKGAGIAATGFNYSAVNNSFGQNKVQRIKPETSTVNTPRMNNQQQSSSLTTSSGKMDGSFTKMWMA